MILLYLSLDGGRGGGGLKKPLEFKQVHQVYNEINYSFVKDLSLSMVVNSLSYPPPTASLPTPPASRVKTEGLQLVDSLIFKRRTYGSFIFILFYIYLQSLFFPTAFIVSCVYFT